MKIIKSYLFGITLLMALSFVIGQNLAWSGSFALSERTHKRLSEIHRLVGKENYLKALKQLDRLYRAVKNRDHEHALVLQTYGYIYADQQNWSKAIDNFERCLQVGAMPEEAEQAIRLNLAQLYGAEKKFKSAVESFEAWLSKSQNPSASDHALGGWLYTEAKVFDRAIKHFKAAIAKAPKANEEWYRGLLAVYYQAQNYKQAAQLLEKMLAVFPDNETYWKQLSNIYYLLKNPRKSVALLEVMHLKGLLTQEKELISLANFYLYTDLPYKAAMLIEESMNASKIENNQKNLQLLSDCYLRANELGKAEKVLLRIADTAKDPELYLKIGQLQLKQEKWTKAVSSVQAALDRGGLRQPGQAYLLQGMAFYEQDDYSKALSAFKRASQKKDTAKHAVQWLNFLSNETSP